MSDYSRIQSVGKIVRRFIMAGTGKHSDIRLPKWGFFSGININMNMTITPQNELL
jgi:hypothetical protein